jgi:DNA-3-methyladenine glycosylase II
MGPYRLTSGEGGFAAIVRSIVAQQLAGSAFRAIQARLEALFDGGAVRAERLVELSTDDLRSTGLSLRKIEYLRDLARHVLDGRIDFMKLHAMDDEAVIETLTQVRGIGRWTADMYLLALNRLDVFPIGDLGIRTAMREIYHLEEDDFESRAHEIADRWRPYRSIACWYLYTYLNESRRKAGGT